MKKDKRKDAIAAIEKARQAGCYPSIEGNWIVWRPCLPADMLMEILGHGDEIKTILEERNQ